MNFQVIFTADDLLGLNYTGNESAQIGRQYMADHERDKPKPSFYAKPGELRKIADHFNLLALEANE